MADETAQQAGSDDSAAQSGDRWGDPISEERQVALRDLFERQQEWAAQPEATRGDSVFKGVRLTGADVFWLAEASTSRGTLLSPVPNLHLEDANLSGAQLVNADLAGAQLKGADLSGAQLAGADLTGARLAGADLRWATLKGADLTGARLAGADLTGARLAGADLTRARLEEAIFSWAQLVDADLRGAQLAGADLSGAQLAGAVLWNATFNSQTTLSDVTLTDTPHWYSALMQRIRRNRVSGPVSLGDVRWNEVDLTVVDWSDLKRLGDERGQSWGWRDRDESEQAARANTQLARRLRDAGLSDDADRFAYRAQVCQRGVHLLRFRFGRWLFSWLLFVVAGYGYRPLRTLFWYLATIASFAFAYYWTTRGVITLGVRPSSLQPLAWYEALVLSVSSFHGRGFLPFPNLGDPVTILAAIEAVFGLFIEVSFIATFTQRYFGK